MKVAFQGYQSAKPKISEGTKKKKNKKTKNHPLIIKAWFLEKNEQDSSSIPNLHDTYEGYYTKYNHFTHLFPPKHLLIPLNTPVLRKFLKKL